MLQGGSVGKEFWTDPLVWSGQFLRNVGDEYAAAGGWVVDKGLGTVNAATQAARSTVAAAAADAQAVASWPADYASRVASQVWAPIGSGIQTLQGEARQAYSLTKLLTVVSVVALAIWLIRKALK